MVVFGDCFGSRRGAGEAQRRREREAERDAHRTRVLRRRELLARFVGQLEARFSGGDYAPALCEMVDMGLPRRVASAITEFCAAAQLSDDDWDDMARFIVWFGLSTFGMAWSREMFDAWSAQPLEARNRIDEAWDR